jgi:hypothetical protein
MILRPKLVSDPPACTKLLRQQVEEATNSQKVIAEMFQDQLEGEDLAQTIKRALLQSSEDYSSLARDLELARAENKDLNYQLLVGKTQSVIAPLTFMIKNNKTRLLEAGQYRILVDSIKQVLALEDMSLLLDRVSLIKKAAEESLSLEQRLKQAQNYSDQLQLELNSVRAQIQVSKCRHLLSG